MCLLDNALLFRQIYTYTYAPEPVGRHMLSEQVNEQVIQ